MSSLESLNLTLATLQPEGTPPAEGRNRLCVCISDVHFTDETVGTQCAEETVWADFFHEVLSTCRESQIDDMTLVLVGDVADMIRTAVWAEEGVYPWQREDPRLGKALRKILTTIVEKHAQPPTPQSPGDAPPRSSSGGFFYQLRQLEARLKEERPATRVETYVVLGNHDKELLADPETLALFYRECLNKPVDAIPEAYRRWIGKMYGDESRFLAPETVPWLPFYWGDTGFRLFVTHGHWRDESNSRAIQASGGFPGWEVADGWRADVWQKLDYRPFTAPCFGDTVAAGIVSTFIYRAKKRLDELGIGDSRISTILDELDLYRPTSSAVQRILQETRRQATKKEVRDVIESELYAALTQWLSWDFTLESSPPRRRLALKAARAWLTVTGPFRLFKIQLTLVNLILGALHLIEKLWPLTVYRKDGASLKDIRGFPTFQPAFWRQGLRIHGEGHTHVPVQSEADLEGASDLPTDEGPGSNFTYVNFGTWRDQIVSKKNNGYRRRGVGRALFVMDLKRSADSRPFRYHVMDGIDWSDHMDQL